jgi:DNA-binding transcriptional LysR family regulator
VSRGAPGTEPIDEALALLGLQREIVAFLAGGFAAAIALARSSDLIAAVPEHHTAKLRARMHSFALPVSTPEFTVSLLWHPRLDADAAHRWLRACVRDICTEQLEDSIHVRGGRRARVSPTIRAHRAKTV